MAQILYKDIIKNKEINEFIKKGDANLATLGYTEHSKTHCTLVAERAAYLLEKFGHADAEIELAKIAGYMHDIGNAVNREHHAEYGALLANDILRRMDMPFTDHNDQRLVITKRGITANHDILRQNPASLCVNLI